MCVCVCVCVCLLTWLSYERSTTLFPVGTRADVIFYVFEICFEKILFWGYIIYDISEQWTANLIFSKKYVY